METRTQPKYTRGRSPSRRVPPSNLILWLTILAIIVTVVIALGGTAIALGGRGQAVTLIKVPDDYPSIQAAIDAARPGDVVQVRAGTYNENLTLNKAVSLTAESFDQINPANNATIIDGMTGQATILIPAGLTQMPTIRGFVIRNGSNGIEAHSEFIAEYNYFNSSGIPVNYQMGSGGINRNNVYFGSRDDAIHLDNTNRPLLIENNRIMYAGDDGIEIGLQGGDVPPTAVEVDIWNNMVIGSNEDGIQFIDYADNPQDTNRRFVTTGNLIANNKRAGIGLMPNANTNEDYSGADTVEALRVYNNTFYGNDYGISGGDNLVAFNNIIANSISRGVWKVQGAQGANSAVAYTLFFGNRLDTDQATLGPGNISGQDPLFVAAPNPGADGTWQTADDDFSGLLLQAGSPAIDKGVTQYIASNGEPIPSDPIMGFTGAAPDLGWREFGSPIFMTSTPSATPFPTLEATATPESPTATFTPLPLTSTSTPVSPTIPPATSTPGSPTPGSPTPVPSTTSAATATAQVTIQSVVPNSAQADTTVDLTITGSGFQGGATVSFEGGQGPAPEVTSVQVVNSTTLVMTVNVKNGGSGAQVWDVRVTNPDSSSFVLTDAFTVNP